MNGAFSHAQRGRTLVTILVFFVIIMSLGLRIYGLEHRGLIEHDEAGFVLASQLYSRAAAWLTENFKYFQEGRLSLTDLKAFLLSSGGGTQNMSAKPLHYLVVASALFFSSSEYGALLTQALFGTCTVFLVFLMGKRIYTIDTGIFAAAMLAVSPYHIYYSRSLFAQVESAFFVALAAYCFILSLQSYQSNIRLLFLTGLSTGLGFTSHYNLFYQIPLFLLYETLSQVKNCAYNLRRTVALIIGIASPIIFFQLIFWIPSLFISKLHNNYTLGLRYRTYFQQLYDQTIANLSSSGSPDPAYYIKLLWNIDGPIYFILIVLGAFIILKKLVEQFNLTDFIILSQFIAPVSVWSISSLQFPRNIVVVLPFAALIAAAFFEKLKHSFYLSRKTYSWALAAGICIVVASNHATISKIVHGTSGYRSAAELLKHYSLAHPGTMVSKAELGLSTDPIWRYYLGNLVDYSAEAGTVFIIDRSAYVESHGNTKHLMVAAESLEPIIKVPNDLSWYLTGDSPTVPSEQSVQRIPGANEIRIYDRRCVSPGIN